MAQFFIGLGVGVTYVGVTLEEIRRIVASALGFCLLLAVLSVGFAEGVHLATGAPLAEALLAFAPGGQGEMVVLALVSGTDMAFVVTHHLVRLMVVILGAPLVAKWLRGKPPHVENPEDIDVYRWKKQFMDGLANNFAPIEDGQAGGRPRAAGGCAER